MRKVFSCALLLGVVFFAACNGDKKEKSTTEAAKDTLSVEASSTVPDWQERDSTVYGQADGFGQGGLTLVTDDGRELELTLTDESGGREHYGTVYGDRDDTARYAVTTRAGGEAVGVMINLTQLERFTKNYEIYNCHLVLKGEGGLRDLVDILELSDQSFVAKGRSGKVYRFRR